MIRIFCLISLQWGERQKEASTIRLISKAGGKNIKRHTIWQKIYQTLWISLFLQHYFSGMLLNSQRILWVSPCLIRSNVRNSISYQAILYNWQEKKGKKHIQNTDFLFFFLIYVLFHDFYIQVKPCWLVCVVTRFLVKWTLGKRSVEREIRHSQRWSKLCWASRWNSGNMLLELQEWGNDPHFITNFTFQVTGKFSNASCSATQKTSSETWYLWQLWKTGKKKWMTFSRGYFSVT